jgi:hypothetical protein
MKPEKKKETCESEQADENGFARFDDLAKKIFAVPKKEIDEKAAEYKAKKAEKKSDDKSR